MKRRDLVAMLAGAAAGARWHPAAAQQGKAPLIGLLHLAPDDPTDTFTKQYSREEGQNVRLAVVSAEGGGDRLLAASRELVSHSPDLIIVFGDPSTRAAQQATRSIPIVAMTDDMLGSGLVASMARPGGNTTGISIFASELDVKRLELLHEAVPQAARIGILADPSTVSTRPQLEAAARRLARRRTCYSERRKPGRSWPRRGPIDHCRGQGGQCPRLAGSCHRTQDDRRSAQSSRAAGDLPVAGIRAGGRPVRVRAQLP
jgi:putative ABC transport system substrate-binding protein